MRVKLTVVGSSPAWPNPGGAQSGYLLDNDGRTLLLDCGPGVLARLRSMRNGRWPEIDAIAITHFHLDHWGDLATWAWGSMFLARDLPKPELWVQSGGIEELTEFGEWMGTPWMFERAFELREYDEGASFRAADLEVTAVRLPHYQLRTYGFRVANEQRTLAYSGDSGPSDRLADLARDVDLFVCEATLLRGDLDAEPRGHLSTDEAIAAFEASGAQRLLLTHRPDELPLDDGLELAYDGLELEV
jgi:ribonuclease BN (tRNA processing enzyme)